MKETITMVRENAMTPQRFWEVIEVNPKDVERAISRNFYVYKYKENENPLITPKQ